MSVAVVTGSGGLIGSAAARHFAAEGLDVVGVDNDMRSLYFGAPGSVGANIARLRADLDRGYDHRNLDVRDRDGLWRSFSHLRSDISVVVHCAAQPAHDWATRNPVTDFDVNATGTVNLLEATHRWAPEALFIHLSTIKVYSDHPNRLPLAEAPTRWELPPSHHFASGIDESMSIDAGAHSLFGASKTAGDIMAQEYGHSLGLRTVIFRPGCLTGPEHAAVEMHGFLGHLVRCVATGELYRIHGDGKQVRDQLHAADVIAAFAQVYRKPPDPGTVFNLGGGRGTDVSVLEAVALAEAATGRTAKIEHAEPRHSDHKWWVTDTAKFQAAYPAWAPSRDLAGIVSEIAGRWA
jgi:CDP-paratose 2-epimerase